MKSKRTLLSVAVILVLLWLVYRYAGHGAVVRSFSWTGLWHTTLSLHPGLLLLALGLSYFGYILRALRWQMLMGPSGKFPLILKGTLIGFTGVAFLGRPGEMIRPYYIARRHRGPFAAQLTFWVVERTLDMGTVGLLFGLDLWLSPNLSALLRSQGDMPALHRAGQGLLLLVAVVFILLLLIYRYGARYGARRGREADPHSSTLRRRLESALGQLSEGMHGGLSSRPRLAIALACSLAVWLSIAWSTQALVLAYPGMLPHFSLAQAILLTGFVSAGSLVQLPAVGGGMQIVTLLALTHIFNAPTAAAVSTALLLWLLSFYAIAPWGVYFAGREGLSWRRAGREALAAETAGT